MEIIKRGIIPKEKLYIGECDNCDTKFRFKRKEAKSEEDDRDGCFLKIKCPVCKEMTYVKY